MKKKQLMALLLSGVMAAGVFAGCGGSGGDNASTSTGGDATAEKYSPENDKVDENGVVNGKWNKEGLPIVADGQEVSCTVFVDDSSSTGEWYMVDKLREDTGIDFNVEYYANEVATEKLSLALSSGDYPEMIGGWLLKDTDILKYGVSQGMFVPLEDYIEAYAPNIQQILDEVPGARETMTAPDGHIYTIPYTVDAPKVDYQISINTRWLKNVGMELPTTTDEFYEVLKAFKEKDANGNGDPNDEIPLSFDPNNKNINYMMAWFGASCDENGMTMKDGEVEFVANTEEFKEGVKFLNKLYSEGLIDPEAFTQDSSIWESKGGNDQLGATMCYASSDFMPYANGVTPDWVSLPVLTSENCSDPKWYQDSEGVSTIRTQLVITNKTDPEDVGAIVRFWDTVFEPDYSIQIINGPIPEVVQKNDNGEYTKIDVSTLSQEEQDRYTWANLWPQALPKYVPLGFEIKTTPEPYQEKDEVDAKYEGHLTGVLPSYWIPLDQADEMSEVQTAIQEYIEQTVAQWIAGQADIDSGWDAYCEQLNNLGLEEYVQMRKETAAEAQAAAGESAETTEESAETTEEAAE